MNTNDTTTEDQAYDVAEEPTFTLEMWTTDPHDGSVRETFVRAYPITMRKHDAKRDLASYILATHDYGNHYTRVPRKFIRVNSVQGVAWDTRNPSRVAYFAN